jgi:hypothetical protein
MQLVAWTVFDWCPFKIVKPYSAPACLPDFVEPIKAKLVDPASGSTKSNSMVTALWRCAAAGKRGFCRGTRKTWAANSRKYGIQSLLSKIQDVINDGEIVALDEKGGLGYRFFASQGRPIQRSKFCFCYGGM